MDEESGSHIASFYLDPFSRPENKRGGAWMDTCVQRSEVLQRKPVAYLVCNSSPPVGDTPSLMSFNDVRTLFHEAGHGLQHMLTEVGSFIRKRPTLKPRCAPVPASELTLAIAMLHCRCPTPLLLEFQTLNGMPLNCRHSSWRTGVSTARQCAFSACTSACRARWGAVLIWGGGGGGRGAASVSY